MLLGQDFLQIDRFAGHLEHVETPLEVIEVHPVDAEDLAELIRAGLGAGRQALIGNGIEDALVDVPRLAEPGRRPGLRCQSRWRLTLWSENHVRPARIARLR